MEKKFWKNARNRESGEVAISPPAPPLHQPPPSGLRIEQLHMQTGRHGDTVMPLSPPSGRALILPAVVLLGHWLQQWACSAPLRSALAAACISPTEESAEPGMRLHTEQATYSLEELNTHREVLELLGNLQDYTTHWRYYLLAGLLFIITVLRNKVIYTVGATKCTWLQAEQKTVFTFHVKSAVSSVSQLSSDKNAYICILV